MPAHIRWEIILFIIGLFQLNEWENDLVGGQGEKGTWIGRVARELGRKWICFQVEARNHCQTGWICLGIEQPRSIRYQKILLGLTELCSIVQSLICYSRLVWILIDMPSYKALLTLIIVLLGSQLTIASPLLWPQPQSLKFNSSALPLHVSPCEIRYIIQSPLQPYIQNIIDFYLSKVFTCSSPIQNNYTLVIGVPSPSINLPLETKQEAYTLIIR